MEKLCLRFLSGNVCACACACVRVHAHVYIRECMSEPKETIPLIKEIKNKLNYAAMYQYRAPEGLS